MYSQKCENKSPCWVNIWKFESKFQLVITKSSCFMRSVNSLQALVSPGQVDATINHLSFIKLVYKSDQLIKTYSQPFLQVFGQPFTWKKVQGMAVLIASKNVTTQNGWTMRSLYLHIGRIMGKGSKNKDKINICNNSTVYCVTSKQLFEHLVIISESNLKHCTRGKIKLSGAVITII